MATHHPTTPARAGERSCSPKPQIGPVTQALRVMLAADPDQPRIRALRRAIADRIEADIALLDALMPDCDLEDGHDTEGLTDDNGIGDMDGLNEQFAGTRYAIGGRYA
ncbi:hypothetical protein [Methylorubrum populi]|nr:hypothetical protein [Methylorubrum populi]